MINNCTISGNTASGNGGGIYNAGTTTLLNSTVANNTATSGGGIYNLGTLTAVNTTIAGNSGGGVAGTGTFNLSNSIIAANTNGNNVSDSQPSGSNNIVAEGTTLASVGLDPMGLKDNGGPTNTIALIAKGTSYNATNTGSNTIADANGLTTDQRGTGFSRIVGDAVDIGAFESAIANNAPTLSNTTFTGGTNAAFSSQLTGEDVDNDSLSYSLAGGALPPGLSLSSDGVLSGTPTSAGTFRFSVSVSDGRGGTATANFAFVVRAVAAGTDGIAPAITRNSLPVSGTRADYAGLSLSGTITDRAQAGVAPSGVKRVLVQLRSGDNTQAYNGRAFTSNLSQGYYPATLGSGGAGDPRTYDRSLSFLPADLAPGNYILLLYPQDNAGNYTAEYITITITAPAARQFAPAALQSAPAVSRSGSGGAS